MMSNKILSIFASFLIAGFANAYQISNPDGLSYGSSWDNPSQNVETVLANLEDQAGVNLTLTMVGQETWNGVGATNVILEELAGYRNRTTFGWYDAGAAAPTFNQIFSGADNKNSSAVTVDFGTQKDVGFYINPNGVAGNRMYTESDRNSHDDIQVAIFKIEELANTYILGWEDLDLNGGSDGDRDYQDMIVRVQIVSVPEPATLALLGLGLLGLAANRKYSSSNK